MGKDGQFGADSLSFELEAILVNAKFALDAFVRDGQLWLGDAPASLPRSVTCTPSLANCSFSSAKENRSGPGRDVLRQGGDGLGSDLFGAGIAAVNGFPEGDDPGSVEFVGKVDFADGHS